MTGQNATRGAGTFPILRPVGRWIVVALLALLALTSPAAAQGPLGAPNDLLALGQGSGDTPDQAPIRKAPSPSFDAVPRATCDSASKPEPSVQGRVPAGSASKGLWCNITMLAHQAHAMLLMLPDEHGST